MHPSPDFLPQPASQQDSHQCHVDDNSAGEDNGGPGKSHWHGVITARQQFYTDRVNADFCHEDDSLGKYRASWMAHTDGEEENCQCAQNNQGQGDSCVPAVAGRSQAMMPKYMAMPRPSRSNVIRKTALVGKKIGRQKIHRTIQVPMT